MIDYSVWTMLISGIMLGAASGITPGPLNTLIISESLKQGRTAGIKVALSPLITDVFIITFSLFVVSQLSKIDILLGVITLLGAVFLMFLGIKDMFFTPELSIADGDKSNPLLKGIITNFLTPHPFIFWITIAGPIISQAYEYNVFSSVAFIVGFYSLLVGFKVILALFTDKLKKFIHGKYYSVTIKILGGFLILFGILLLYTGVDKLLG